MKDKKVALLVGSKSDMETVEKALDILRKFNVDFSVTITSAHRALKNTIKIVEKCKNDGTGVFVVCAGASAHLAGVVAAISTLPVIGVPVGSSVFKGIDSLFSIVQMPKGIPVATVGVNAAANAAILAVEILALNNSRLEAALRKQKHSLAAKVIADNKEYHRARKNT